MHDMNILVLLADSFRPDHLGCYGNPWIQTPHLDALARESVLYRQATAEGPITLPARNACFTGRYTFPYQGWGPIQNTYPRLAEVLRDAGYTTALIADTTPIFWPGMNFTRGFDYVEWVRGQWADPVTRSPDVPIDVRHCTKRLVSERHRQWLEAYLRNISDRRGEEDHFVARVCAAAARWLEAHRQERFFLWVDSFDPHEPWDPPPPYDRLYYPDYQGPLIIEPEPGEIDYLTPEELRHIRAQYAGEVTLVDTHIGRLLEAVRRLGLLENTVILFLSDHGEPLGEHGIILKARPWPYEEIARIPLLIRHPQGLGAGLVADVLAQTPDIMPTVLGLVGVEVPNTVQGQDVWSAALNAGGDGPLSREAAYVGYYQGPAAVRTADWKLIQFHSARESQLFHLAEDPRERRNLIDLQPERAAALAAQLEA